jgi:hypothetical protein
MEKKYKPLYKIGDVIVFTCFESGGLLQTVIKYAYFDEKEKEWMYVGKTGIEDSDGSVYDFKLNEWINTISEKNIAFKL